MTTSSFDIEMTPALFKRFYNKDILELGCYDNTGLELKVIKTPTEEEFEDYGDLNDNINTILNVLTKNHILKALEYYKLIGNNNSKTTKNKLTEIFKEHLTFYYKRLGGDKTRIGNDECWYYA